MTVFPSRLFRPRLLRRRQAPLRGEQLEPRRALSASPNRVGIIVDDAAFARAAALVNPTPLEEAQATRWVVRMSPGTDVAAAAAVLGATAARPTGIVADTFIWEFPQTAAGSIPDTLSTASNTRSHGVVAAYPLVARQQQPRLIPDDPLFANQWHLRNTGQSGGTAGEDANVAGVWDTYRGTGVTIAIVDDGLQHAHPDLVSHYVAAASYDFNDDDPDPTPVGTDGHGTAAGGVAAATGDNGLGVSGAAPGASLAGLRLIAGPADDLMEATALTYALADVDIYSNSWGPADSGTQLAGPGPLTLAALEQGITEGRGGLGAIYVWSAGNGLDSNDNVNYDGYANSRFTIAVTAIDNQGQQSWYAEPGAAILVAAPSNGGTLDITTTDLVGTAGYNTATTAAGGDYTNTFGGTSSAAPLVSGVVALMLEANPNLGWRDVQHVLVDSARRNDPTDADWLQNGDGRWVNHKYGFGAVDASAAVTLAENWTAVGPEVQASSGTRTVGLAIPDNNPTGISTSFTMSADLATEWVEVTFSATHPFRGDLEVVLTSPSGTQSVLAEERLDSGNNYAGWKFTSARHWGESSAGTWTLTVRDLAADDLGTFTSWSLDIYGTQNTDGVPPAVAITSDNPGPLLVGDSATITFSVSEPVANFTSASVTTTGGVLSAFSGSGTTYTATFTPTVGFVGNATIGVAGNAFTDAAGNGNIAGNIVTLAIDTVLPTLTISRSGVGVVAIGATDTIVFSLSAPSADFTVQDVTVTGGSLSSFSGSGASYTATFTPTSVFQGNASVAVDSGRFTNLSGNPNQGAALSFAVDTAAPTVSISRTGSATLRIGDTTTITFTLSESATNFVAADVSVSGGFLSGFTGSGRTYSATFGPNADLQGIATLAIAAGAFTDAAGNPSGTAVTLGVPVDTVAPTILISRGTSTTLISGGIAPIDFSLSEPSTNFSLQDIAVTGGTLSGLSGSGTSYTGWLTPTAAFTGLATVTVTGGAFTDAAGNGNLAAIPLSLPVDTSPPTLSISHGGGIVKDGNTAGVTFTFSEPPSDFTLDDIAVSGGSISNLTGAGFRYAATFTPSPGLEGTAVISVAAGSYADVPGNRNLLASTLLIEVDVVAPTLTIVSGGVPPLKIGDRTAITFLLSEPSANFSLADISVSGAVLADFMGIGGMYTALLTPSPELEGFATVTVEAGAFADEAGNPLRLHTGITIPIDTIAPRIAVSRTASSTLIIGDTTTVDFMLSEFSPDFSLADVVVSGGTLSELTGSGTFFTAMFRPAAELRGSAIILLPGLRFNDLAGNGNAAGTSLTIPVDTVQPTLVGFTSPTPSVTLGIGGSAEIIAEFSDPLLPGQAMAARLNSGGIIHLVVDAAGHTARGSYTVQPGEVAGDLDVLAVTPNGTVRNAAGNALSPDLPAPPASLAARQALVVDGAVKFISTGRFSTDPNLVADALTQFRQVPIRFSTPVTGLTLSALTLTLNGRHVPMTRARLTGAGAVYALSLPISRLNPIGIYRLSLMSGHPVRASANAAPASSDFSLYWGFGRSIGMVPDAPGGITVARIPGGGRRGAVALTWQPPRGHGGGVITQYTLEYRIAGSSRWFGSRILIPGGATGTTVSGLPLGNSYEFRVAAVNAAGQGAFGVSAPFRLA